MKLDDLTVYAQGRFMRYADAKVGLLTHGLQYGTGCFEGVRGFWDDAERELYILHPRDHYVRLHASAKILMMQLEQSPDELVEITVELCTRNRFEREIYIRPFVYKSDEAIGVRLHDVGDAFAIVALPFDSYFGAAAGLRACVSSWRRIDDTAAPARAKVTGIYINSALAKSDALLNGFDEAILLSHDGHVSEGSAENFFMVKDGALVTPDATQNILEGVTRRCVMTIARDLGIPLVERAIDRSELYTASEAFFTGSAAGVMPIESIDRRPVGDGRIGKTTKAIADVYERAVRGKEAKYRDWVTPVYRRASLAPHRRSA
ncbi:MAG: branched-chain amino acid transaminase [Candidatus Eremiobacteraeota bacterium]|nr:branched-chain amino acid transaminase [Candidatus Eremiobacteraeota bacterium]